MRYYILLYCMSVAFPNTQWVQTHWVWIHCPQLHVQQILLHTPVSFSYSKYYQPRLCKNISCNVFSHQKQFSTLSRFLKLTTLSLIPSSQQTRFKSLFSPPKCFFGGTTWNISCQTFGFRCSDLPLTISN